MRTPLPIPAGWFALGPAADLRPDSAREQLFCGRRLMVWRDADGRPGASEGPRQVPLLERSGMLMAWHHPDGDAPDWELEELDGEGWTAMTFTRQELPVHPLHVMRDLADLVHFESVHLYKDIEIRRPLSADGPRLDTAIAFGWDTGLPGVQRGLPASFEARVEGPGYQRTEVLVPMGQWESRHLVLPTPLGDGRCALHLGVCIRLTGHLGRLEERVGRLGPVRAAIHAFLARMFVRDIARDAGMWVTLPHVVEEQPPSDAHMALFRQWQAQFLPQLAAA